MPALSALRDPARPPDGMTAVMMEIARSRRDAAASSPCAAALYRKAAACDSAQFGHSAAASHVAPVCWTSAATRSPEDTVLSAGASPPSLVRIGPLRMVHEQYRELGTSGGSDEPSWSRSQWRSIPRPLLVSLIAGPASRGRPYGRAGRYGRSQAPKGIDNKVISNCTTQFLGKQNSPTDQQSVKSMIAATGGSADDRQARSRRVLLQDGEER